MIRSQGTIVTMGSLDESRIAEVCELLVHSFRDLSPTWVPTVDAARAKVIAALEPGMLSRVLLIDDRVVGGWERAMTTARSGSFTRSSSMKR